MKPMRSGSPSTACATTANGSHANASDTSVAGVEIHCALAVVGAAAPGRFCARLARRRSGSVRSLRLPTLACTARTLLNRRIPGVEVAETRIVREDLDDRLIDPDARQHAAHFQLLVPQDQRRDGPPLPRPRRAARAVQVRLV